MAVLILIISFLFVNTKSKHAANNIMAILTNQFQDTLSPAKQSVDPQTNYFDHVMTKFIVNNRKYP